MKMILKHILIILAFLAAGAFLFVKLYRPFGATATKSDWNDYARRADNFSSGVFRQLNSAVLMTGEKSQFDRTRRKPVGDIPVCTLTEIPDAAEADLNWVWLGHSSSLLQLGGQNILIDPVFSSYVSPMQGVGPSRFSRFPVELENLPQIDVLAVSHDHYDHLDYRTILGIDGKVSAYVVPLGVEKHLIRWGVSPSKIHNMAWWEEYQSGNVKITATPGQHFTNRIPWKPNSTLWCGYAFQTEDKTVYFTGDTGYGDFFPEIGRRIGKVDLLLLECGQYDQTWAQIHSFPEQGIQVMQDVNAEWTVPIHWGAYSICNHPWDDSINKITAYAAEQQLNLATPQIGQMVHYDEIATFQDRWWEGIE